MKLNAPLALQLAVHGSRSKINSGAKVRFEYQNISEERYLDIINLSNYDVILGTLWMYQHQGCIGLNPPHVVIGCDNTKPINGSAVADLSSQAVSLENDDLEPTHVLLWKYAKLLCKMAGETELPPLRVINHMIPLIDENKVYQWCPSCCPEALHSQWVEKRDTYLCTGCWEVTNASNTIPMLLIMKPQKPGEPALLRTVFDLRTQNENTHKMTSPLPDPEGILRWAAHHHCCSMMDGKDAYKQIHVDPAHVHRMAVTMPDRNMVSHVIQQGNCNTPATYQALMNHLFSLYIGWFMDVYLDDIIIYSNTVKDHVSHVKMVIDVLTHEKLYLSEKKLHFLCPELQIGQIITDNGIQMDPYKVGSVLNWKTPTNHDLLHRFLGSVGYLADDYAVNAPQVWMVTDGCVTGIAGVVSQGVDWKSTRIVAFFSAKLNLAQQNYPVHEIEMLARVETMLQHHNILQGVKFKWITDHKGLVHLLSQKNLSDCQVRWIEKISKLSFEVEYVAGSENVIVDALSHMYSADSVGTVRAKSEYTYFDIVNEDGLDLEETSTPVLAGIEAHVAVQKRPWTAVPGAETGRPETAKEFAARMRDCFVLKPPAE